MQVVIYTLYGIMWTGYLSCLTYIILFKGTWDNTLMFLQLIQEGTRQASQKVYLIPFESTRLFIENWEYAYARWNIFGNILLFVPFGILAGLVLKGKKGAAITLLLGGLVSLGFEVIQYLYAIGEFDVDDLIWNVVGVGCGYLILFIAKMMVMKNDSTNNGSS